MKKGVLILECLGAGDPGSEGQFILRMLNLMEIPVQYITVRMKEELIQGLKSPRHYSIIHVATHGSFRPIAKSNFRMEIFLGPHKEIWLNVVVAYAQRPTEPGECLAR